MRWFGPAVLATAICAGAVAATPDKPIGRDMAMPAIGDIKPPAGTQLVGFSVAMNGGQNARQPPHQYQVRSPLPASDFRRRYELAAKSAGYRVARQANALVGVRRDGRSFRLLVVPASSGCTGSLTMKPPGKIKV